MIGGTEGVGTGLGEGLGLGLGDGLREGLGEGEGLGLMLLLGEGLGLGLGDILLEGLLLGLGDTLLLGDLLGLLLGDLLILLKLLDNPMLEEGETNIFFEGDGFDIEGLLLGDGFLIGGDESIVFGAFITGMGRLELALGLGGE